MKDRKKLKRHMIVVAKSPESEIQSKLSSKNISLRCDSKNFKCNKCGKSFNLQSTFNKHALIHVGERPFSCIKCGKSLCNKYLLKRHFQTCHSYQEAFITPKSTLPMYSENESFNKHILNQKGKQPFSCEKCGKKLYDEFSFMQHLRFHSNEKTLVTCPVCLKGLTKGFLSLHLRYHVTNKRFKCKNCSKRFFAKYLLRIHHLCAHRNCNQLDKSNKNYSCGVCGKIFKLKIQFINHRRLHEKEPHLKLYSNRRVKRPFSCEECGMSYVHKRNLDRHHTRISLLIRRFSKEELKQLQSLHLKKRKEKTNIKEKTVDNPISPGDTIFLDRQPLNLNTFSCESCQKVYVGRKPVVCDSCKKEFPKEPSLSVNPPNLCQEPNSEPLIKVCSENETFKCFICSQEFPRLNCLQVHVQFHSCKEFTCGLCGVIFRFKTTLHKHLQRHIGEKPYECDVCQKTFVTKFQLNVHLRVHSGERPFICEVCGKPFKQRAHYTRHVRSHHNKEADLKSESSPHSGSISVLSAEKDVVSDVDNSQVCLNEPIKLRPTPARLAESEKRPCRVCKKKFSNKNIARHMRSHNKEKLFKCHICEKSYADKYYLDYHLKVHSVGEKRYKCKECGKSFYYRPGLRKHLATHRKSPDGIEKDKSVTSPHPESTDVLSSEPSPKSTVDRPSNELGKIQTTPKSLSNVKKYPCHICGKEFRAARLTLHIRSHTGEKPYQCDVCGKSYADKFYLDCHRRVHSEGEKKFKCKECGKSYYLRQSLRSHLQTHAEAKPFPCDICGKSFSRKVKLEDHQNVHSGEKPFSCQVCGKSYHTRIGLRNHSSDKKNCDTNNSDLKNAVDSKATDTNTSDSNTSVTKISDQKTHACDFCPKKFKDKSHLISHLRIHTGETPFKCDVCQKSFKQRSNLKKHSLIHEGVKAFMCEQCSKTFYTKSDLGTHLKICNGEKPFKCDICDKSFRQRGTLNTHRLIHDGIKAFLCDQCSKTFYTGRELKRHSRICNGEKPFVCEFCQKAFRTSSALCVHRRMHTGEKPYVCKSCQRAFASYNQLKRHTRIHTGDKPYQCDVCQKGFTQKYNLKIHLRTHNRTATISSSLTSAASRKVPKPTGLTDESYRADAPMVSDLTHQMDVRDNLLSAGLTHHRTYNRDAPASSGLTSEVEVRGHPVSSGLPNHMNSYNALVSSGLPNPSNSYDALMASGLSNQEPRLASFAIFTPPESGMQNWF